MIKVALTGNIGSGKSTVAKIFNIFGVPVFHSDIEARLLYNEQGVKDDLRLIFSDTVFNTDGEIDAKKLASIIFNNKLYLQEVNSIIHPLVLKKYNQWCDLYSAEPYTIHETAILFENKLQNNFDLIINVSAPKHIRLKRVMNRDGISESKVEERMANQLSDEFKVNLSQFVIVNDGSGFLTPQVKSIHNELMSKKLNKSELI